MATIEEAKTISAEVFKMANTKKIKPVTKSEKQKRQQQLKLFSQELYLDSFEDEKLIERLNQLVALIPSNYCHINTIENNAVTLSLINNQVSNLRRLRVYTEYYFKLDNRFDIICPKIMGGPDSVVDHTRLTKSRLINQELFHDFALKENATKPLIMHMHDHFDQKSFAALIRDEEQPDWTKEEIREFQIVASHLYNIVHIKRKFDILHGSLENVRRMFDRFSFGIVTLNGNGRVNFANRYAEKLFSAGNILKIEAHCLRAQNTEENRLLQNGLGQVNACIRDEPAKAPKFISLRGNPDNEGIRLPPLLLYFLPNGGSRFVAEGQITVLINSPFENDQPGNLFRMLFGLSPRQAEVLEAVLKHGSHKETTAALFISNDTLKSHLREIFRKTGAKNVRELFRLTKKFTRE